MIIIRTLFISIFLLTVSNITLAAPPAKDVNVVNTPDVNVVSMPPIEANVNGPIEATITEPVEVIVNELPGVIIDNGPNNPVPVIHQQPTREIVMREITGLYSAGDNITQTRLYTVPVDKIMVIETVSFSARIAGQDITRAIILDGANTRIFLPLQEQPFDTTSGSNRWVATERVQAYAPAGDAIWCQVWRTDYATTSGNYSCSIFGYLLPAESVSIAP